MYQLAPPAGVQFGEDRVRWISTDVQLDPYELRRAVGRVLEGLSAEWNNPALVPDDVHVDARISGLSVELEVIDVSVFDRVATLSVLDADFDMLRRRLGVDLPEDALPEFYVRTRRLPHTEDCLLPGVLMYMPVTGDVNDALVSFAMSWVKEVTVT